MAYRRHFEMFRSWMTCGTPPRFANNCNSPCAEQKRRKPRSLLGIRTPPHSKLCANFCRRCAPVEFGSCSLPISCTKANRLQDSVCGFSPGGNKKLIRIAPNTSVRNASKLPSGPTSPPVSHVRPEAMVAFERWPSKIPPLSGTEYKKLSPKSKAACHPTASHNEPVRRKVNAHSKPVKNILATPNQFSPLLVRWTRAKTAESTKAAGQKPIPSAKVCCRY